MRYSENEKNEKSKLSQTPEEDISATRFVQEAKSCNFNGEYTLIGTGLHPLYELAQSYLLENPSAQLHPAKRNISENFNLKNNCSAHITDCQKSLEVKMVCRHLPQPVLNMLFGDSVCIEFMDGAGSAYDAIKKRIECKGTDDFYHEIGHHYWNSLIIPENENDQRHAVTHSLSEDHTSRMMLPDILLPSTHKRYAQLVGAETGQFLFKDESKLGPRMNDLDEHFARNFDYLIRGKPLEVLDKTKASLDQMLDFYEDIRIIDKKFRFFYKMSIAVNHNTYDLKIIRPPYKMADGLLSGQKPLSICDIADLHVFKRRMNLAKVVKKDNSETYSIPNIPLCEELGLRLDITPEFVKYCLEKDKKKVFEALVYTKTGTERMERKIREYKSKNC